MLINVRKTCPLYSPGPQNLLHMGQSGLLRSLHPGALARPSFEKKSLSAARPNFLKVHFLQLVWRSNSCSRCSCFCVGYFTGDRNCFDIAGRYSITFVRWSCKIVSSQTSKQKAQAKDRHPPQVFLAERRGKKILYDNKPQVLQNSEVNVKPGEVAPYPIQIQSASNGRPVQV